MKVLFSPIGNTDPWNHNYDGAMLHIVRHYKPEYVYLYFTESIWKGTERIPGRKSFDWESIVQSVSPTTKVKLIIENITHEHDFDSYKETFHDHIQQIRDSHDEPEILLNVTSGTPQMESTLCLEYITYPEQKLCIQVAAPDPSNNGMRHFANPNRQLEELAEVNQRELNAATRSRVINIISFREAMIRSQLKELIKHYDYEAAYHLINENPEFRNSKILKEELLALTKQIKTHTVFPEIMEKYTNKDLQKVLLHYLLLNMRYKRQDVAETLIRVKSIAEYILRYYIDQKWPGFIIDKKGKPYITHNTSKNSALVGKYKLYLLQQGKNFDAKYTVSLPAYIDIIVALDQKSPFLNASQSIININDLRNSIAHQLEPLKLESKKNMEKIKKAVEAIPTMISHSFPDMRKEDFDFLEYKNEKLIGLL
ncbi:type III-A CRISPR-associated CARF protein Csm6 [Staphylococcus pseudintermedius]|uniref:type III-A CRISPR-associated CARF protein Csm6 n=1 Tax=Staphylococcus pseudintermedius TaxID=283734 RepID=UPI001036B479|nr:type III-A CRISPR-associated CARF protein Csm6 [Staphylococcus pseudintermedius]EGQ0309665.1 type III-A CRISPR-associated protein Csm6 [Staphylococcus pseudintermedius]EGQ0315801.1 type III-A CRISPR-associated protein Csm6 [Staphylococcus pseudintermedius]EGQ0397571.1 type III-A CRISPR-associated protein Csm6 [Staphylococcus pseudintermedius]EGQ1282175.1 type III-A CRISPR-associated protein Csm6 [Staphylococcus pseudintermedius]EGQ1604934.1 type III-A CRISPR-associated protein Csm6 [Staphyl